MQPNPFWWKLIPNFYSAKKVAQKFALFQLFATILAKVINHRMGENFAQSGTDVMILKIFSQKNRRKIWRFWLKTKLNYAKRLS
jgi:hypothetical protein